MRAEDQVAILAELRARLVRRAVAEAEAGGAGLSERLAESVFHAQARQRGERDKKARREAHAFWEEVRRGLGAPSLGEQAELLERIVARYGEEIRGHFDPRVHASLTRVGPPVLGLLFNTVSPKRLLGGRPQWPRLDDALMLQGELEHLRRLHELGTVILVPTHVSNMDSIVIGWVLHRLGLPPFAYGASRHLFANAVIGFFLQNLGAYSVDRRNKDPLYRAVLKEYTSLTLEHGLDTIFFPGGTRSRSGAVERRLKLGLLGTGVGAFVENLRAGRPSPRIFIVPATLSYQLVLEAETLIDDFLKEVGQARYIIADDEFSQPHRVAEFTSQLFALDSKIFFTVGRGLDPFGNPVDDEGRSLDPRGRVVDPADYVCVDGAPVHDAQRDAEFTREVGERVAEAFSRDNVLQATHVTAQAVWELLARARGERDPVRLVRGPAPREPFALADVYAGVERLLVTLRGLAARGAVRLAPLCATGTADEVAADALRHFATYHRRAAAQRRGDRVLASDRALLLYYRNRLDGYLPAAPRAAGAA